MMLQYAVLLRNEFLLIISPRSLQKSAAVCNFKEFWMLLNFSASVMTLAFF